MNLRIRKTTLIQYFLIYFLLIVNQTNLYHFYLNSNLVGLTVITLGILLWLLVRYRKESKSGIFFSLILLFSVVFVRIAKGGIGIFYWYDLALKIYITYLAIAIDRENFITRFIKLVSVFALISLVFWVFQIAGINLAKMFFSSHDTINQKTVYDLGGYGSVYRIKSYGMLIYSYLENEPYRNTGIYTEPGVYQMVLNSALFFMLFMDKIVYIPTKKKRVVLIILVITLISVQSTSGYLGLGFLILCFLASKANKDTAKWRKYVVWCTLVLMIGLSIDYYILGNNSFIYTTVITKLLSNAGQISFTLENSTGQYRVASIGMAILAMIKHPLGLGVNGWESFYSMNSLAGAGGFPFKLGAIIGVIPFVALLTWLFKPLKKISDNKIMIIAFLFLYFNTSLAQTSAVYPALTVLPVLLYEFGNRGCFENKNTRIGVNKYE